MSPSMAATSPNLYQVFQNLHFKINMKKLLYISALVLGLGFAACDDYREPNPPAQSNPQESILKTDEVNVTPLVEGVCNLADLNASGSIIEMANINCATLPAGYEFVANVEISADDFASAYGVQSEVTKTGDNYVVSILPSDLQGVYYENISKSPAQADIQYRLSLMTRINTQLAYVGGPGYYYGPFDMTILPFPSENVIENTYYLVTSADNWDFSKAIKLSNSGKSPYDDPKFSATFEVTNNQIAAGYEWKVIPESTYAAGTMTGNTNYGGVANEDNALAGTLVLGGDNGVLNTAGQYQFVIDMSALTYEFASAVDFLYTPGDANGWNQSASQVLYTNNYEDYYGYAYLSTGGFKFTSAPDWNHTNYGLSSTPGALDTDGSAGNLTVEETGLYWCHVNTVTLTYEVTLISTYGVIGDSTPGGWDASTALTPSEDFLTWEGDIEFVGGEFKFRANDDWGINLGGALENLTQDGSNIASPGEGTYHVVLNLGNYPYSATITKK